MNLIHWISGHLSGNSKTKPNGPLKILNRTRQVVLAHRVEIADHGATRRKGLLGRDNLPAGEGLWIVPCESVHTFGMRFPIDLVYLDRNKKVKKIRSGVPPWRLSACLSAHSVVELASGTVQMTQTKPGDQLEFSSTDPLMDSPVPALGHFPVHSSDDRQLGEADHAKMSQKTLSNSNSGPYGRAPSRAISCACIRANTRPTCLYTVVHTVPEPAKRILLINDELTLRWKWPSACNFSGNPSLWLE